MAKTYNPDLASVSTGDVYTAAAHNLIVTNVNNYRVPPACRVYKTAESTANGTWEIIGSWTEDFDTDGMWTSNNNYIEVQTAGIYVVAFYGPFTANGTNDRGAVMTVNDASTTSPTGANTLMAHFTKAIGLTDTTVSASAIRKFSVGDKLRLHVFQNGGTLDIGTAAYGPVCMEMAWVGQVS